MTPSPKHSSRELSANVSHDDHGTRQVDDAKCSIIGLPDELLTNIFTLAFSEVPTLNGADLNLQGLILKCVCVCKRFYNILLPLLYHDIQLHGAEVSKKIQSLHSALQKSPSLARQCRTLGLDVNVEKESFPEFYLDIFGDLGRWLVHVKYLTIVGGGVFGDRDQRNKCVRLLVHNMTAVQNLNLTRAHFIDTRQIMDVFCSPSLTKLNIRNVLEIVDEAAELDGEHSESANLTDISLFEYRESPEALARLLNWPKNLVKFHFDSYHPDSIWFREFNLELSLFRPMLLKHKNTLRSLNLGDVGRRFGDEVIDLRGFEALEELTISRFSIYYHQNPDRAIEDARRLLSPSLKHFTLNFEPSSTKAIWADFGPEAESWVRSFTQEALERGSSLKRITLDYNPGEPLSKRDGYPWDRMSRLRDDFGRQGMIIDYPEPIMTKEEWTKWAGSFEGNMPRSFGPR